MGGILYPEGSGGLWVFLLVSVVLGGAAAAASGRSAARLWLPFWRVPFFVIGLAAAVRFLHATLFAETLLSPHYYAVDYVVLLIFASLGYWRLRRDQMVRQYQWEFEPAGPLGWRRRPQGPAELQN